MNDATSAGDQARRLIADLGFDGAQAEAEQAVLRADYFDLEGLAAYWLDVATEIARIRDE